MSRHASMIVLLLFLLLLIPQADAKNKKKQTLPDYVLRAEKVLVVIHPQAGEPLTNPGANRTARDEVEEAIMKWGRFRLATDSQTADLVIAVRKGHASGPTIRNSPTDERPGIGQQTEGEIRLGAQRGHPPDLTDPGFGGPERRGPHPRPERRGPQVTNEVGPSEDLLEVYPGGGQYPLDWPPVWRYTAKDALKGPPVDAVEQFRKAIAASEEQRRQKN
jgi:hypothetical protein